MTWADYRGLHVSSNFIYDDASGRDAVMCFCKQLEKFVEEIWLLSKRGKY